MGEYTSFDLVVSSADVFLDVFLDSSFAVLSIIALCYTS